MKLEGQRDNQPAGTPPQSPARTDNGHSAASMPAPQRDPHSSITWITPRIAIGNFVAATDTVLLKQEGIRAIYGLIETLRDVKPETLGVDKIIVAPMHDGPGNTLDSFRRQVGDLQKMVVEHEKVLVHCHAGKSRSVALVAAVLRRTEGYDAEMALRKVEKLRAGKVMAGVRELVEKI